MNVSFIANKMIQEKKNDRVGHSLRTPFPSIISTGKNQNDDEQIVSFVERVQDLIKAKCSEDIVRLGLCAGGFVDRASQGSSISSYFQANSKNTSTMKKASSTSSSSSSSLISSTMNSTKKQTSEQGHKKTFIVSPTQKVKQPVQYFSSFSSSTPKPLDGTQNEGKASKDRHVDLKIATENHHDSQSSRATETSTTPSKESDDQTSSSKQVINEPDIISQQKHQQQQSPDLAYALKLQASYDRENEILSKTENKMKGRSHGLLSSSSQRRTKKARIDSFFKLKK